MLLVRAMPGVPTAIWRGRASHELASQQYSAGTKTLSVSLSGVHQSPCEIKVYAPQTGTPQVTGGTYEYADGTGHLHTISFVFSTGGTAEVQIQWP